MKRRLSLLLCTLLAVGSVGVAKAQSVVSDADKGYHSGVVRVKLQPELASRMQTATLPTVQTKGVQSSFLRTGITAFDRVSQKAKAVKMTRVFPEAGKYEARHKEFGLDLWYTISYEETGMTATEVSNLYKAVPGVTYAERVPVAKLVGGEKFRPITPDDMARAAKSAATMPFNDPLLKSQWHYNNDGSMTGAKAGADANIFKAWETGVTGSKDVLVAIIDGGFQVDHPDLKDNVWINEAELNGKPGVDDDGDGYVDDIYGYNFVIGSADISAHSHGTHVAGTVGATNGNGIGVCGVAGGTGGQGGVKMMVCQVFDSRVSDNVDADFGAALVYAADQGASIAQCSWGYATADVEDKTVSDAVRYFTQYGGGDKMNGGLCIFSAGNTGEEGNYYPGCLDEVVAVGAMNAAGTPAYYSSRGTWVDVTAPGGLMDDGQQYGVLSTLPGDTYGYNEGTSMACPHVSGIAALILSKYGNKNFSNETLRTLLTSSVNDLYSGADASYQGLFGSGYIDAYKALQGKEGSTPGAVTDMVLTPSHDEILVEWTIPESEEQVIDHHVLYYSTSPITSETNLTTLPSAVIDTKFKSSGDKMQYELTGLKATTTYYMTMVAYNRWGTASTASPVMQATTNAGPVAKVSTSTVTMNIAGATSPTATGSFDIANTGEGLLKYELTHATKKVSYAMRSTSGAVMPGRIVPFTGQMETESVAAHEVVSADYNAEEWPKTLAYYQSLLGYIGESDTELPNAMAQRFTVEKDSFPDGFNLTALNIAGSYGENPTIEIYGGASSISKATLLETISYDYFIFGSDVQLNEQVYFAPGESFWVVVKFAAGQKRPLCAAKSLKEGMQQNSFYSSDDGATWTQLSEVVKEGNFSKYADVMTWAIKAKSKNPDWSTVLQPTPLSGEVRSGQTQKVTLTNDGQKLVNGTYNFNIHVKTNEAEAEDHVVPVTLNVTGYKPEPTSKQLTDFGNLLVGQSKTLSIEIVNNGYGLFGGQYGAGFYPYNGGITTTSDQFDISKGASAVAARSTGTVDVTFKPTKAGDFSSTITLTDKDKNKYSFVVRGSATEPAKLALDKDSYDFGDLEAGGDKKTATFTLTNNGKYPLQYIFPKYSTQKIEGSTEKAHKYGYTYISNIDGSDAFAYSEVPTLPDEKDITSQFSDNNWLSGPIDVGFSFPFYGEYHDKIYITSHGGVSMNTKSGTIGCFVPEASCMSGLGYISAYGNSGYPGAFTMTANSRVTYGHKDGRLYIVFKDCDVVGNDGSAHVSLHMVLCPDGSAEMYYDDYDPTTMRDDGMLLYVGVVDENITDPYTLTDADHAREGDNELYAKIQTGTAIKIVAPATSIVDALSSTDGYVGIGESKDITVTVAAGDANDAGATQYNLVMLTNDPDAPSVNLALKANITGDGLTPALGADSTAVDFGRVYRGSDQTRYVTLRNTGRAAATIDALTFTGSAFALSEEVSTPCTIAAHGSKDLAITVATAEEGAVEGSLKATFSDGTSATLPLTAIVIGAPDITLTPAEMTVTTTYGVAVDTTFTIANSGNETLTATITPDTWFTFTSPLAQDGKSTVDYTYKAKSDGYDVACDWTDITADYDEHMALEYYYEKTDYKEVTLPFSFPFYGKMYDKMYIYNTGFVSFTAPTEDYKQFPEPPAELPSTDTFYKNIICPFWGNHSMASNTTDGVYYKGYDDHAVVTFKNYGNSVMVGMNFQLIIRKDGTFKFLYGLEDGGMFIGAYGLCGIMNDDCTRGITPSDSYINPGNAIEFSPVMQYTVAPSSSVEVPLTVKADQLADTYSYSLDITTDVPHKEKNPLPVTLVVNGDSKPVFPETVTIEQVADPYYNPSFWEFEIANEGTRAFTIDNVESTLFDFDMSTYSYEAMLYYWGKSDNDGGDVGPLSVKPAATSSDEGMGWISYNPGETAPISVGLEPVKFRIIYYNVADVQSKSVPMTFTVSGLDKDAYSSTIKVNITQAPVLTFDRDSIYVQNASADYTGTETVTIGNTGKYPMTYSLRLDPSGHDEATEDGGDDPMPGLSVMAAKPDESLIKSFRDTHADLFGKKSLLKADDNEAYIWDLPSGGGFTNSLYYPILKPVSSARATIIGTGSSALSDNFYAATRYTAPAEGFNLTHLYFVGTVGDLTNVDIEATVILGNDVSAKKRQIGHGKIRVEKEEKSSQTGSYNGEARMLRFDEPVFINPGDTFYVVLKYPAGYATSAVMASKDGEMETNRYMAYLNSFGGWVDIEELYDEAYSYGAFGYFMSCIEHEEGEPWIKMLTDKTEGTLQVGETLPVTFQMKSAGTYFEKGNQATLVLHTNDPTQKVVNYHITLDRNAAPTVTLPKGTPTVSEGDTVYVSLTATDADGDDYTLSLSDDSGIASIATATAADGSADVTLTGGTVSVKGGKTATIGLALAPDYETAGNHTATIVTLDAGGNRRETDLTYHVDHTNRAPIFYGATSLDIVAGQTTGKYEIYDFFEDPDYDDLAFTVTVGDSRYAEVYTSETGFVLQGKRVGQTTLTLAAADTTGAKTTAVIDLRVVSATGIDDATVSKGDISVSDDGSTVTIGKDADKAVISLYDNGGKLIAREELHDVKAGQTVSLPTDGITPGVYHLSVDLDGEVTAVKFGKK